MLPPLRHLIDAHGTTAPTVLQRTLATLVKYLDNIASAPNDLRFRRIKTTNRAFSARIAPFGDALAVLASAGFVAHSDDALVLPSDAPLEPLRAVLDDVRAALPIAADLVAAAAASDAAVAAAMRQRAVDRNDQARRHADRVLAAKTHSRKRASLGSTVLVPAPQSFAGLANQGATCYLNAYLQTLFHCCAFRALVYAIPFAGSNSVIGALQLLFCELETSRSAEGTSRACVSTRGLTDAFGWSSAELATQHDVQELSRVLLANIEDKLAGTELAPAVADLFAGTLTTTLASLPLAPAGETFVSSTDEPFYDLTVPVAGHASLEAALSVLFAPETMDGDNQYAAPGLGLRDATKRTLPSKLPQLIQFQLARFAYNPTEGRMAKITSRFSFPVQLDMPCAAAPSRSYNLFAVLVHAGGSPAGGHYYAFIRTGDSDSAESWIKFNDAVVTLAEPAEALDANFGGGTSSASAYMLLYAAADAADVLGAVPPPPTALVDALADAKLVAAHAAAVAAAPEVVVVDLESLHAQLVAVAPAWSPSALFATALVNAAAASPRVPLLPALLDELLTAGSLWALDLHRCCWNMIAAPSATSSRVPTVIVRGSGTDSGLVAVHLFSVTARGPPRVTDAWLADANPDEPSVVHRIEAWLAGQQLAQAAVAVAAPDGKIPTLEWAANPEEGWKAACATVVGAANALPPTLAVFALPVSESEPLGEAIAELSAELTRVSVTFEPRDAVRSTATLRLGRETTLATAAHALHLALELDAMSQVVLVGLNAASGKPRSRPFTEPDMTLGDALERGAGVARLFYDVRAGDRIVELDHGARMLARVSLPAPPRLVEVPGRTAAQLLAAAGLNGQAGVGVVQAGAVLHIFAGADVLTTQLNDGRYRGAKLCLVPVVCHPDVTLPLDAHATRFAAVIQVVALGARYELVDDDFMAVALPQSCGDATVETVCDLAGAGPSAQCVTWPLPPNKPEPLARSERVAGALTVIGVVLRHVADHGDSSRPARDLAAPLTIHN
ncbi:uncharacterized protein AMSG_00466 [Thecamonas trahens ATCC 50062]|uniref:USP domain-containing protein n=1 Tax=Thecamonas trahens ATCC 50062 TaxID=461836 RepID=A0A0L0D8L5_THETB|nr:hypothetical protein AMSG_00466 [Thecamonas trahens ATCC 50062]KNC48689.1 hypothetical protein AMSG_00466 [Thecamonas trahens ATCC 50062]|eukprot:XP_013762745.1 hypothetical protein AMSG_00466 [Thecamonas trahens ATCC 50062]